MKRAKYKSGEFIVKEGDDGNEFFFLEEGEAVATKNDNRLFYLFLFFI